MNRTKQHFKRIVSFVLCMAFLFLTSAVPRPQASELDELNNKIEELQKKIAQNEKKLDDIKADKSENKARLEIINAQLDDLDSQMSILNSKISVLNGEVSDLNSSIAGLENNIGKLNTQIENAKNQIAEKEAVIDDTLDKVFDRMVADYMAGESANIEILLNSSDMSAFFTRSEYLKLLAANDKLLVKSLEKDMAELNAMNKVRESNIAELNKDIDQVESERATVVKKRNDVNASADQLGSKQSLVNSKYESTKGILRELDQNSAEYKAQIERWRIEEERTSAAIDAFIARQGSNTDDEVDSSNDGSMTWPVPYDNCYISAGYPYYPSGGQHGGIDICVSGGSTGKKIVAAQGGKVISAGWNGSYGNCIILDHGSGLFTLYGHCSSLAVSSGQKVSEGQVIAYIGSTGNVTGPHLHFEVRVNNNSSVNRVQPLNYVSKP